MKMTSTIHIRGLSQGDAIDLMESLKGNPENPKGMQLELSKAEPEELFEKLFDRINELTDEAYGEAYTLKEVFSEVAAVRKEVTGIHNRANSITKAADALEDAANKEASKQVQLELHKKK